MTLATRGGHVCIELCRGVGMACSGLVVTMMENAPSGPLVVLVIGMAGTGKTTLVQRINHYCVDNSVRAYFINTDPAVLDVPFDANIDIRDAVNYKEVMRTFRLGPNGAILTSLNLFATKIDQVINLVEQKKNDLDFVFVDTPGQIEVFTWSASGQIIMEAFSSTFPTCLLFVGDTTRCVNPQTFMSTMLYSSSILYKSQLPLLVAFNKCDVAATTTGARVTEWVRDPEALSAALKHQKSYVATLTDSLALFLHEFYETLRINEVSALDGSGITELFAALAESRQQYLTEFWPALLARGAAREQTKAKLAQAQLSKLRRDVDEDEQRHNQGDRPS